MAQLSAIVGKGLKAIWMFVAILIGGGLFGLALHTVSPGLFRAKPNAAVVKADSVVQHTDTVFVHDTTRVATARAAYRAVARPIRLGLEGSGPQGKLLVSVVAHADTAFAVDSTAIENCARLVAAQTKLIATLQPPPPRLQYFVEPLYSVTDGAIDVRGGAEYRLFGAVQAVAAVQVGPNPGLFVGARITFR